MWLPFFAAQSMKEKEGGGDCTRVGGPEREVRERERESPGDTTARFFPEIEAYRPHHNHSSHGYLDNWISKKNSYSTKLD